MEDGPQQAAPFLWVLFGTVVIYAVTKITSGVYYYRFNRVYLLLGVCTAGLTLYGLKTDNLGFSLPGALATAFVYLRALWSVRFPAPFYGDWKRRYSHSRN